MKQKKLIKNLSIVRFQGSQKLIQLNCCLPKQIIKSAKIRPAESLIKKRWKFPCGQQLKLFK